MWRNTHGGLRTGSSYLDNLDVQFSVDGERAWGRHGLAVLGRVLHNNGGSVTEDLVGDAQAISNIEGLDQTRAYELWAWAFGVVATGALASRPEDRLGFGLAIPCNGRPYRRASALAGQMVEPREHAFELTYHAQIADWLALQPTVQYIVEPDSIASRPDALAVALRFVLAWSND